jgi:hypothetical protein
MYASRIQGHASDGLAAFSVRTPEDLLELTPTRSLQDLVITLVALLVARVHHPGSYSVTLGNRTGTFLWPRQMRGSLRWRVSERD